jgi:hypothetical protein
VDSRCPGRWVGQRDVVVPGGQSATEPLACLGGGVRDVGADDAEPRSRCRRDAEVAAGRAGTWAATITSPHHIVPCAPSASSSRAHDRRSVAQPAWLSQHRPGRSIERTSVSARRFYTCRLRTAETRERTRSARTLPPCAGTLRDRRRAPRSSPASHLPSAPSGPAVALGLLHHPHLTPAETVAGARPIGASRARGDTGIRCARGERVSVSAVCERTGCRSGRAGGLERSVW